MRWLDQEIEAIKASTNWCYYRISTGPVVFCVGLTEGSAFLAALDAFACVEKLDALPEDLPIVWVSDAPNLLNRCSDNCFRELLLAQAECRFSQSNLLLNWDAPRGLLKYFNGDSNRGLFVAADLTSLPSWEWFSPLKEFVHLFALAQGAWLAHAASVSVSESSGVLLVGPGGSGKSTTCAHMVQAGYQTCGDDYVLLTNDAGGVFAHAIYRTIKLMPREKLGNVGGWLADLRRSTVAETGKSVYFMDEDSKDLSIVGCMSVKRIYGLRLVDNQDVPIQLSELSYTHFAMSSHGQIPVWLDRSLSVSKAIFERLPKKMIDVRRDNSGLQANAAFLREVLG